MIQGVSEIFPSRIDYSICIDIAEIFVVTILLIFKDLSDRNRPFDWLPIACTLPFALLLLIQGAIAMGALIVLVWLKRAAYGGTDAWWVALAGLSILRSLPGGGGQNPNGTQLIGLADFLFQKFYGDLRLVISKESGKFKKLLINVYATDPDAFLNDTKNFISCTQTDADVPALVESMEKTFRGETDTKLKIEFLADIVAPMATRKKWKRLTGW